MEKFFSVEEMLSTFSIREGSREQDIGDLLRSIAKYAKHHQMATIIYQKSVSRQEIVVDIVSEGIRYVLIRIIPELPRERVKLSEREKEIFDLVSEGYPNKAIGVVLQISPWTVATHLRRVFSKLNVNTRAEMVACVMKEQLLDRIESDD